MHQYRVRDDSTCVNKPVYVYDDDITKSKSRLCIFMDSKIKIKRLVFFFFFFFFLLGFNAVTPCKMVALNAHIGYVDMRITKMFFLLVVYYAVRRI
jgi:hypothetical protein